LMECCSSFLHFFVFNPLQNTHNLITALTRDDKLKGGWWVTVLGSWYDNVDSPRRVNSTTDGHDFSFIYVDYNNGHPSSHVCVYILALMWFVSNSWTLPHTLKM